MRAVTLIPETPDSARLEEVPEPGPEAGPVLVETLAVGVCGTDIDLVEGRYGWAPPGRQRLILGHESLGRVREAPAGCGLAPGDLVVGVVRRPDPVPCACCAAGEWDMCRNGRYTEHGIKELDGFCAERFRLLPGEAVRLAPALEGVGVLLEPASILAKAWEQIERIGARSVWQPRRVLVTGAGPIGLLAALLGVQRGLDVHVLDRVTEGPKPELVRALGATYHSGSVEEASGRADVVLECTGAGPVILQAMQNTAVGAIVCLTGVSSKGPTFPLDVGALNRELVLENDVIFGSVNANRRHYQVAADALARADRGWLERLLTRRVPLGRWQEALRREPGDVKTVIDFTL